MSFPTGVKLRAEPSPGWAAAQRDPEGESVSAERGCEAPLDPMLDGSCSCGIGPRCARGGSSRLWESARTEAATLEHAHGERARAGSRRSGSPSGLCVSAGFVSGEEHRGRERALRRPRQADLHDVQLRARGVGGAPTLVQAPRPSPTSLIARYGPAWFRELGMLHEPGSALVTISGAVCEPGGLIRDGVGTPSWTLSTRPGKPTHPRSVRYSSAGTSEPGSECMMFIGSGSNRDLSRVGADLGARAALPVSACGVCETARAARYLAAAALFSADRVSRPTCSSKAPRRAAARDCRVGSPM